MELTLDDIRFHLEKGSLSTYVRILNLYTGELRREVVCRLDNENEYQLVFRRFVSLRNLHLLGSSAEITPITAEAQIKISSGINGQMTNSGAQHFFEGNSQILDRSVLRYAASTTESGVHVVTHFEHHLSLVGQKLTMDPKLFIDRRKVAVEYEVSVPRGETLVIEKLSTIHKLAIRKNEMYKQLISKMTPKDILPGISQLLKQIEERKIKIGLASASHNAPYILHKLDLLHYFKVVVNPSQLKQGKPAPDIFLASSAALGVEPARCVAIEDSLAGIKAIQRAGMFAVGIGNVQSIAQADMRLPARTPILLSEVEREFAEWCRKNYN